MRKALLLVVAMMFAPFTANANYVGSDAQYFNPTPGQLDFFTTHSSRTLPEGQIKASLFFDFAKNLHYSPSTFENDLLNAQIGVGYGIMDGLSLSLTGQGIAYYDDAMGGKYTDDAFTFLNANLKYKIMGDENGGLGVILNFGYGFAESPFAGDGDDYSGAIVLAYDRALTDSVRWGLNLGYRYMTSNAVFAAAPATMGVGYAGLTAADTRDEHHILASTGFNFGITDSVTGVTELYATLPADQFFDFSGGALDQKGAEVLLGLNFAATNALDIGLGTTVGVFADAADTDWRVFLGAAYRMGGDLEAGAFNTMGGGSYAAAPVPVAMPKVEAPVVEETVAMPTAPVVEEVTEEIIQAAPTIKTFNVTAQFKTNSAVLTSAGKAQLDQVGAFTSSNAYKGLVIEGHTDSMGSDSYNLDLSQRRANAAKEYLANTYGIARNRMSAMGYGEAQPIDTNATKTGRQANRRVTVNVK